MNYLHAASHQTLDACAPTLSKYGHALSLADTAMLIRRQTEALRETGRVDFGGGILGPLALAFCDSPYIQPTDWPDTLAARFHALGGSLTALTATEPDWFLRSGMEGRWRDD